MFLYALAAITVVIHSASSESVAERNGLTTVQMCENFVQNYPGCSWIKTVDAATVGDQKSFKDHNSYGEMVAYAQCAIKFLNNRFYATHTDLNSHWRLSNVALEKGDSIKFDILQEPPTTWKNDNGKTINVKILHSFIRRIEEDELTHKMSLTEKIRTSWTHERLNWSNESSCLKRKFFRLWGTDAKTIAVWRPNFQSTQLVKDIEFQYMGLSINGSTGTVAATVEFTTPMKCSTDFVKYPFDTQHCIITVMSFLPFVQLTKEPVEQMKIDQDYLQFVQTPKDWKLTNFTMGDDMEFYNWNETTKQADKIGFVIPQISYRLEMKRNSQLAYKISAIMLATSVTVGMFGPITGNVNGVKFTKLLSIATSVAGLMTLALHNHKIYHSPVIPQIFKMFEFTMAVSILSLLLFLSHYHLMGTVMSNLPPHYILKRFSNAVSLGLFWIPKLSAKKIVNNKTDIVENCETEPTKDYSNDWLEISGSLHRCLFVIFFFVYLIGTVCLISF